MILVDQKNERQILKEEFELTAANIKNILLKKTSKINIHEKDLILSTIKKVIFIKSSFDIKSSAFTKILTGIGMVTHCKNGIVFEKGDEGNHFYIVLQGIYCVEIDNIKEGKKQKQIYYEAGDSFGQVSLIYDVPRGARIIADSPGTLITIKKSIFNECGNLRSNILYLNNFFNNHSYFQKQDKFMIRVVSSISKLSKFTEGETIIDEGTPFSQIFFFVKGQAKVYKTLNLSLDGQPYSQTIEIDTLTEGDVYGQHFYTNKESSTIRIVGINRGQYIRVAFKDNIQAVENELYKRIRQNASKFPTDQQFFNQFQIYLEQKFREVSFLSELYKTDRQKIKEKYEIKKKLNKVKRSILIENS